MGDAIDLAARNGQRHVTVPGARYATRPRSNAPVTASAALRASAGRRSRRGQGVPRISGQLVVASANDSFGAGFIALDPALDDRQSFAPAGQIVAVQAVLGRRRAGHRLVGPLAPTSGPPSARRWLHAHRQARRDRERPRTGQRHPRHRIDQRDASLCLLRIAAVRALIGYGDDEATQLAVYLRESARRGRRGAAPGQPGPAGRVAPQLGPRSTPSWQASDPEGGELTGDRGVRGAADRRRGGDLQTLFVSVMEAAARVGILLAIGFRPAAVPPGAVGELWLALVGLAAGAW